MIIRAHERHGKGMKIIIEAEANEVAKLLKSISVRPEEKRVIRASDMNPYPHGHPMFMSHGRRMTDEEAKAWEEKFLKECAEKGIHFNLTRNGDEVDRLDSNHGSTSYK